MAKATDHPKNYERDEERTYIPKKSEKDKITEAMAKKGFNVVMENGVPMFTVSTKADYEYIKAYIRGRFSFGLRAKDDKIFRLEET